MKLGIAGAGLLGRLLAFRLQPYAEHIHLFDRDISGKKSAAYAAAGMLAPYAEHRIDSRLLKLSRAGINAWKKLLPQFSNRTWFQQNGSLMIAHAQDQTLLADYKQWLQRTSLCSKVNELNQAALQQLEPELTHTHGFFIEEEASIDTRLLLNVLSNELMSKLMTWHDQTNVRAVDLHCITTDKKKYSFDWVLDCRGMGGQQHFADLRGVRGELIYLHAPHVTLSRPVRLLHPRYPLYVVPRANSIYLIGASEIETEDNSPISVRSSLELLSAAYSVHPGFAEARIIETITALRPTLMDHLPRILWQEGLTAINGLYRHGFLLAAVLTQDIVAQLKGGPLQFPNLFT